MKKTVGIGVVGMGWMGNLHSRSYRLIADHFPESELRARLVHCADVVAARAEAARQQHGFDRCSTRWEEVIADPEVEAVSITAGNDLHLPVALAAAGAGKAVYCEKPVGRHPRETALIAAAARQAGIASLVGYNYRWAPLVQFARQLIETGELGSITHFRGRFFAGYGNDPGAALSWRYQRDLAGLGVLGDLMSHVADMALFLAGPIARVVGNRHTYIPERFLPRPGVGTHFTVVTEGPRGAVENEDYAAALVSFSGGAQGTLEAARVIEGPQCEMAFEINGTEGAMRWNFEAMNELWLHQRCGGRGKAGERRILSGPEHPFHANFNPGPGVGLGYQDLKVIEAYQFLRAASGGVKAEPDMEQAARVGAVLAAMERSWASGTWEAATEPESR